MTDLKRGPGLEIAPLHRPIARKEDWDVSYVDIVPTEQLIEHYGHDDAVPNDKIVEVDFPLTDADGTIRTLAEVAGAAAPFEWVIASHVIEHVPDLITWLGDIATLLSDGGALLLAVPDRRYSFDAYRPQTTVGQMLQAHHQGDLVPSVRAVYDALHSASSITATEAWAGKRTGLKKTRIHSQEQVLDLVEQAKQGTYIDSHVWTFRPSTFIEQINELGRMGMCEFVVEKVRNTRPNELEFYAVLRRLPRERTPEQDAALRAAAKHRTNDEPKLPQQQPQTPAMRPSDRERRLIERKRQIVSKARRLLRRVN
jgi:2-polyprenyl-3-methyl-5-hydroxy-6-metoxy-1,4-benzoquinol methylase